MYIHSDYQHRSNFISDDTSNFTSSGKKGLRINDIRTANDTAGNFPRCDTPVYRPNNCSSTACRTLLIPRLNFQLLVKDEPIITGKDPMLEQDNNDQYHNSFIFKPQKTSKFQTPKKIKKQHKTQKSQLVQEVAKSIKKRLEKERMERLIKDFCDISL